MSPTRPPKMGTETLGLLPNSTLGTGTGIDAGVGTADVSSGPLAGSTPGDVFTDGSDSPKLNSPVVSRRKVLGSGLATGLAAFAGCRGKKEEPKTKTNPPSIELPPDGTGAVDGHETFARPDGYRPGSQVTVPDASMPRGAKILFGVAAVLSVAGIVGGFLLARRSRKTRHDAIKHDTITGDELQLMMKPNEWYERGTSIQVRLQNPEKGHLSVPSLGHEADLIRIFEDSMPPLKKREEGVKYRFEIRKMLESIGVKERDEQDRVIAQMETDGAIARGWIKKYEPEKDELLVGDHYYSTLTRYRRPWWGARKLTLRKIRKAAQKSAPPAGGETVGDTNAVDGDKQPDVKIENHAFSRLREGGYVLGIGDKQWVKYPDPWQGMVIEAILPQAPGETAAGKTVSALHAAVKGKGVTVKDVEDLLRDLLNSGVLAVGDVILDSGNEITLGTEYHIMAPPAVPLERVKKELGGEDKYKNARVFQVSSAKETRGDTGGQQQPPGGGTPEPDAASNAEPGDPTVGGIPPASLEAFVDGVVAAPAAGQMPSQFRAPPAAAGRKRVDRDLSPEEGAGTVVYTKGEDDLPLQHKGATEVETVEELDISQISQEFPLPDDSKVGQPIMLSIPGYDDQTYNGLKAAIFHMAKSSPLTEDGMQLIVNKGLAAKIEDVVEAAEKLATKDSDGNYNGYIHKKDGGYFVPDGLRKYFRDVPMPPEVEEPAEVKAPPAPPAEPPAVPGAEPPAVPEAASAAGTSAAHTIMTPIAAQRALDAKRAELTKAEEDVADAQRALDEVKGYVLAAMSDLDEARQTHNQMKIAALGTTDDKTAVELTGAEESVQNKKGALEYAENQAKIINTGFQKANETLKKAQSAVEEAEKVLEQTLEAAEAKARKAEEAEAEADDIEQRKTIQFQRGGGDFDDPDVAATQEMELSDVEAGLAETPEVRIAREHWEAQKNAVAEAQAEVGIAQTEVEAKTAAVRSATRTNRRQAMADLGDANDALGLVVDVLGAHERNEETARAAYENALREAEEAEKKAAEAGKTAEVQSTHEDLEAATQAMANAQAEVDAAQAEVEAKTAAVRSATKENRKQTMAKLSAANEALEIAFDALEEAEEAEEAAREAYEQAQQRASEEAAKAAKKDSGDASGAIVATDPAPELRQFHNEVLSAYNELMKRGNVTVSKKIARHLKVRLSQEEEEFTAAKSKTDEGMITITLQD